MGTHGQRKKKKQQGGTLFSGKKKKEYLKEKKKKKREARDREQDHEKHLEDENNQLEKNEGAANGSADSGKDNLETQNAENHTALQLTQAYSKTGRINKLTSQFVRLSDELVEKRKADSARPLDVFKRQTPLRSLKVKTELGLPKRPLWDATTTKEELEGMEETIFDNWLNDVHSKYTFEELSPFEHNLEVWRQLWRTIEKSDIVVIIVDIRNPLLHIPSALYDYIVNDMKRTLVLLINKIDLVSQQHIDAWVKYLSKSFPTVSIVLYSTKAKSTHGKGGVAARRKIITARLTKADKETRSTYARNLLQTCLSLWNSVSSEHENSDSLSKYPTIGFVGHPNVGKSSVLNSIIGSKVVSVSRSCGHTKHWQTHLLRESNHGCIIPANVGKDTESEHSDGKIIAELVDSPGLVFPFVWKCKDEGEGESIVARHVFELCGLYPIPQIRETSSAIRLLAEHIELERFYNLRQDVDSYGEDWSPYGILGCFADKKGYAVKGGGPDFHRAGLEIIRDVVDGYVLFTFLPPED